MLNYQLLKSSWKWFSNKYLIQTILWLLLTITLIICAILWESSAFSKILEMDFFNNANKNPKIAATLKTYLYIAIVTSCVASNALIFIQIKCWIKKYIEAKYEVVSNFENNFFVFKTLLVLNVAKNITYVFCFTNVFTSFLVLMYWFLYTVIYFILTKLIGEKNQILDNLWWKDSQKRSLFLILGIESSYLIGKNIVLQVTLQTVDIDQVLKYFIPASSLALILAVFIQSLVKNNVKTVLANMNGVTTKVNNFKIFYNWDYNNAISDFSFIKEAPLLIRQQLKQKVLDVTDKTKIIESLHQVYQFLIFLEQQNIKTNELKYIYYHLFYELTEIDEISQIKNRIIKTKNINRKALFYK